MPQTSNRVQQFTESVIRGTTRIANQYGAINLSQGFPDFDPPQEIIDALKKAAHNGPHQYATTWGADNFRRALATKQSRFMGIDIDPETDIVVTCGGTEAMMVAMMTTCNPGDKVIVFSPFYENYAADAILSGAEPIYVPLHPPAFSFHIEELRRAFEQRPKAIVLCNPSNPSGKVFSRDELQIIADFAEQYDVFVITDEVYEHIIFAPHEHVYFASLPGMFQRTLSCSSLSKTYSITGWRLGYVIAPKEIIEQARKVHDFLTVGAAAPLQEAAVVGLEFPQSYYEQLAKQYTEKRDIFLRGLDVAGLKYVVPQGTYFVMVDISEFGFPDDSTFCEWMIKEIGVAPVAGSAFFKEPITHYVRFHFAKSPKILEEAVKRIATIHEKAALYRGL